MERLIAGGKVTRGYLGIFPQDITPGLAEAFHLPNQNGALVGNVFPDTPAQKAGIQPGDVITAFNGKDITDRNDLMLAVSECAPGSPATVKLVRNGAARTINLKLAELPGDVELSPGEQDGSGPDNSKTGTFQGVTVANLRIWISSPSAIATAW